MGNYSKADLRMTHYGWDVDRTGQPGSHDLNLDELDLAEGHEVLLYANAFLDIYVPDHTVEDLHVVEYLLFHSLPLHLRTKSGIATWMAGRLGQSEFIKKALSITPE